jgi:hypothetical protein
VLIAAYSSRIAQACPAGVAVDEVGVQAPNPRMPAIIATWTSFLTAGWGCEAVLVPSTWSRWGLLSQWS